MTAKYKIPSKYKYIMKIKYLHKKLENVLFKVQQLEAKPIFVCKIFRIYRLSKNR